MHVDRDHRGLELDAWNDATGDSERGQRIEPRKMRERRRREARVFDVCDLVDDLIDRLRAATACRLIEIDPDTHQGVPVQRIAQRAAEGCFRRERYRSWALATFGAMTIWTYGWYLGVDPAVVRVTA